MYWMDLSPVTQKVLISVQLSAEGWQYPCKRARNGFSSPCPFSDSRKTQLPIVMLLPLQRQSAAICPMMEGRQFPLQDFSIARCGFLYHPEMGSGKSVTSYWGHSRVGGQGSSGGARLGEGAQQLPISRWSMYVASWNHGRPKLSSPDASMQAFGIERERSEIITVDDLHSQVPTPMTYLHIPPPSLLPPPPLQLQVSIVPASQYPPYSSLWHLVTGS